MRSPSCWISSTTLSIRPLSCWISALVAASTLMSLCCYNTRFMSQLFRVAAITDEFSPDIEKSVSSMVEIGMTGAELRMLFGKNIIDLTDDELDRAGRICKDKGLEIISI